MWFHSISLWKCYTINFKYTKWNKKVGDLVKSFSSRSFCSIWFLVCGDRLTDPLLRNPISQSNVAHLVMPPTVQVVWLHFPPPIQLCCLEHPNILSPLPRLQSSPVLNAEGTMRAGRWEPATCSPLHMEAPLLVLHRNATRVEMNTKCATGSRSVGLPAWITSGCHIQNK